MNFEQLNATKTPCSREMIIPGIGTVTVRTTKNFLHPDDLELLDVSLRGKGGKRRYDRAVVVSLDAEWFEFGGVNVVLSYQVTVVSPAGVTSFIYYTPTGRRLQMGLSIDGHLASGRAARRERLSLEQVVEMALCAHAGGRLGKTRCKTRVILVAHSSVAEYSVLADRDQAGVTKHLTAIRKSPVTGVHPIRLRNSRIGQVDVVIFDTRLLAPARLQSLADLSSLLGEDEAKIKIGEADKRRMDKLLQRDPELFERYAVRDAEVTAQLFFLLQRQLNRLAFGSIERLFKTLGSAAVQGFLRRNKRFKEYREKLLRMDPMALALAKRSYLGGLNMSNFRGDTRAYAPLCDCVLFDIDFASAYSNGMSRCPKIDHRRPPEIVQATYRWTETTAASLQSEGIPPDLIETARNAVEQGRDAVEAMLRELRKPPPRKSGEKTSPHLKREVVRGRAQAKILREVLLVPDNRLLDRWCEEVESGRREGEIPGFARVRFHFTGTSYPCLPIKKAPYGLCYPLSGETTVPATELVLAIKAGAKVEVLWSVEFPVERDEAGKEILYFVDHLKYLVELRVTAQELSEHSIEAAAQEKLLKEMINAFYGKTAQGLNYRRMYSPATGEVFALAPSEMTEPTVAALTTAQVRAALASVLLSIEAYNAHRPQERPLVVLSATTDGFLLGLPCAPGYSVAEYFQAPKVGEDGTCIPPKMKKGIDLVEVLQRFGHPELLEWLYRAAPLRHLRDARKRLTKKDDFLEIKHMADRVVSVKKRGQIGMVSFAGKDYCTLLARFGHRVPLSLIYSDPERYASIMQGGRDTADAEWLLELIARGQRGGEIETYPSVNLPSFKDINDSEGELDLVSRISVKRTNVDWDYTRELERDADGNVLPTTRPYSTIAALLRDRRQADAIRRGGLCATPELVATRLKNRGTWLRARAGQAAQLTRVFLRGLVRGEFGGALSLSESETAKAINRCWQELAVQPTKRWTRADVSNAKRAEWTANALLYSPRHERLLAALCEAFAVDLAAVRRQLFATDAIERDLSPLAAVVAQALLNAPRLGIEPFASLYRAGALPGRTALAERLYGPLGGRPLPVEASYPAPVPASERAQLRRLFVMAGLSGEEARLCAEALAPLQNLEQVARPNPNRAVCLERFVTALHQPDIHTGTVGFARTVDRLKRFGLTKKDFLTARGKVFAARDLKDTPANRRQIEAMALALDLDATKFLDALLEAR